MLTDAMWQHVRKMFHYEYRMHSPGAKARKPRRRPAWHRSAR
jgi:hypothetical protein